MPHTSWFVRITDHKRVLHDTMNTLPDSGHSYQQPEDLKKGPIREPEEDGLAECMPLHHAYLAASLTST